MRMDGGRGAVVQQPPPPLACRFWIRPAPAPPGRAGVWPASLCGRLSGARMRRPCGRRGPCPGPRATRRGSGGTPSPQWAPGSAPGEARPGSRPDPGSGRGLRRETRDTLSGGQGVLLGCDAVVVRISPPAPSGPFRRSWTDERVLARRRRGSSCVLRMFAA